MNKQQFEQKIVQAEEICRKYAAKEWKERRISVREFGDYVRFILTFFVEEAPEHSRLSVLICFENGAIIFDVAAPVREEFISLQGELQQLFEI